MNIICNRKSFVTSKRKPQMDTQKTLDKINNRKVNPEIEKKIIEAKRYSTSQELLQEMEKKYPIPADINANIPAMFFRQFLTTQALMMASGIFLSIDWQTNEYFAMDLQLGKEIRNEKKKH